MTTLAADLDEPLPMPTLPLRNEIRLTIADPVLARAVSHVIAEMSPRVRNAPIAIGDEDTAEPVDVLVIPPTPVASRKALDHVTVGAARAVVTTDALELLHHAVQALSNDLVFLPRRVVTEARRLPSMSDREVRILRGMLAGYGTATLCQRIGVSETTLKRSMSSLMTRLSVADRSGLVTAALELGIRPNGLVPTTGVVARRQRR